MILDFLALGFTQSDRVARQDSVRNLQRSSPKGRDAVHITPRSSDPLTRAETEVNLSIGIPISHMLRRPSGTNMTQSLSVPRSVLKELQDHARQIEEIVATLEELADQKGIRKIRSSLKEYEQGEYVVVEDPKEMKSLLGD